MNNKDPKYKTGDFVRISKYKNIFAKGYVLNCSEEVFEIKKVKKNVSWTYIISDLNPPTKYMFVVYSWNISYIHGKKVPQGILGNTPK